MSVFGWVVWALLPGTTPGWSCVTDKPLFELEAKTLAAQLRFPARAMPEGEPPDADQTRVLQAERRAPNPRR